MSDEKIVDMPKRGPGRPPRQEAIKTERRRRKSTGMDRHFRLKVPDEWKDPNYHYHWIMNRPGRLENLTKYDDYEIVTKDMIEAYVGHAIFDEQDKAEGSQIKRAAGTSDTGQWQYHYLCRKPKEYYDEDKKEEQEKIDRQMEAVRQGNPVSPDGLGKGDHAYTPRGHQNVVE